MTRYWNVKDQIHTIKRLWTKLKYNIKIRDQIFSLPFIILYNVFTKLYKFAQINVNVNIFTTINFAINITNSNACTYNIKWFPIFTFSKKKKKFPIFTIKKKNRE